METRLDQVFTAETFHCPSRDDPSLNILDGLELHSDVIDPALQRELLEFVEREILKEKDGMLKG
jgi:hypothetical protein